MFGGFHLHVADNPGFYAGGFQQLAHAAAFGSRTHNGYVFLPPLAEAQVAVAKELKRFHGTYRWTPIMAVRPPSTGSTAPVM